MSKPVIVCVDDEKFVLDSLRTTLSQAFGDDYLIEIAEDGDDALAVVKDLLANGREVPVVISDYVMPHMRGDELLQHIQIVSQNTLKIMLTGQANIEGVTNAVNDADLYRFVSKPWNNSALVQIVRKAVEEYFSEKEKADRSRALLELTPDLVLFIRRDGMVLDYRGPEEDGAAYAGKFLDEIFPGEIARMFSGKIDALPPHGECVAFDYNLSVGPVSRHFETRLTSCGADAVLAVARDVSANKEVERALHASESILRAAFDNAPFEFWTSDCDGRCLVQNSVSEATWGPAEGKFLGDPTVPSCGFGDWKTNGPLALSGKVVRREVECMVLGETRSYLQVVAPVHHGHETLGVLGFNLDVTEQARAQEALRTAKSEAEDANRAKSAFLAAMSHEIRTPLNGVVGFSSLLMDTTLDSEQREFADTVHKSAENLLSVVNDILDFSKIEAGRIELDKVSFDLREAVEDCIGLVAPEANRKKLELCALIDEACPEQVMGDVTRLRQILTNLLSNAVKFTEQGEVDVSVGIAPAEQTGGGRIVFRVRDTGIGMSDEQQQKVFEPFIQADASTTRRFGGTGLGLAISGRLVELMGGSLRVDSCPGKGSTFSFSIPLEPDATSPGVPGNARKRPLSQIRVAVVDDNATNRRYLELQLKSWGAETTTFDSGPAFLKFAAAGGTCDEVLLDYHMPDMDGVALAKALREVQGNGEVPIILLSSGGAPFESLPASLFSRVFTKPVNPRLLRNAMTLLLGADPAGEVPTFPADMAKARPLRILLAEDNPSNQKLLSLLLGRLGYGADIAANGLEVVDLMRQRPYDVVLMDIQMPEMDGLQATRLIRSSVPQELQPVIIALTAHASEDDRLLCHEAGMDEYLTKPIRRELLTGALERAYERRLASGQP